MPWYHYSEKQIKELNDEESQSWDMKPKGLWLSYNNDWEDWINREEMDWMKDYKYKYKVTLRKNTNICVIDSIEILEKFIELYEIGPIKVENSGDEGFDLTFKSSDIYLIDWEKVSEDYDGIKFINYPKILGYIWREKIMKSKINERFRWNWYLSVDINSMCIWRPSKVISKLIEVKK